MGSAEHLLSLSLRHVRKTKQRAEGRWECWSGTAVRTMAGDFHSFISRRTESTVLQCKETFFCKAKRKIVYVLVLPQEQVLLK